MRKVELRMNEQKKYEVIKELVNHKGNKNRVAIELGITRRQVDRLVNIYKEKGKSGFVHGNRSKKPKHTIDKRISEDIILLYRSKYQDFNFNHFKEYLESDEGIKVSYRFVYKTLTEAGILSPKAQRKTKKQYKKRQMKQIMKDKTEEELNNIVNHEMALEDSHPRQEKPKNFGEVIEMDGSIHLWFGDKKSCLHLSVDRATNMIPGGYFDYQETLNGYYHIFQQILTNYGIPYSFLTDNRTVFNYMSLNPDKRVSEKDVLTQFGYACKQLGVDLKTTSVSQAKGLIERDNGTFQDRLVNELRLNGITTIEEANKYLTEVFIPKFNKKFAMDYTKFPSVFEKAPNDKKINYTLAILTPRKIDNGNAIKFKNKYYQPYLNDQMICFMPHTECLVIEAFNKDLLVTIDEKVYEMKELSRNVRFSKNFDEVPNETIPKPKYIPPMSHPWKAKSFESYMKKAHLTNKYA